MTKELTSLIVDALNKVMPNSGAPDFWSYFVEQKVVFEKKEDPKFGDYACNVAMVALRAGAEALESHVGEINILKEGKTFLTPKDLAEEIKKEIDLQKPNFIEKIEVAGPGFLNFFLSRDAFSDVVKAVLEKNNHFADSTIGQGTKMNIEFISANPTGPLHLGNGRGGFYGDSLSRLLRKCGFEVTNEYYINDAGEQVTKLGHSVIGDSEAVYGGEYIEELRTKMGDISDDAWEVGKEAAALIVSDYLKPTIESGMQIRFDVWTSERALVESGVVDRAIEKLREQGRVYEDGGALWLKTTDLGDDKDRVLIKSDGNKTYFASECGYILSKLERGYDSIIEIWGADHHGYVNRFNVVLKALTGDESKSATFLLMQLVKLMKDGEEVRMSKRAGNVVTIDELIERVGHDVTRFFFLQYSPDTHMTFDLGLAEERSQKNPVYYVQYAHARMASILEKAKNEGYDYQAADLTLLTHEKERSLIREMLTFQDVIELAATESAPHRLPQLAIRLADKFHSYYGACQVIDGNAKELSEARLALVAATKIVLGETLRLIGVSAPEKM